MHMEHETRLLLRGQTSGSRARHESLFWFMRQTETLSWVHSTAIDLCLTLLVSCDV